MGSSPVLSKYLRVSEKRVVLLELQQMVDCKATHRKKTKQIEKRVLKEIEQILQNVILERIAMGNLRDKIKDKTCNDCIRTGTYVQFGYVFKKRHEHQILLMSDSSEDNSEAEETFHKSYTVYDEKIVVYYSPREPGSPSKMSQLVKVLQNESSNITSSQTVSISSYFHRKPGGASQSSHGQQGGGAKDEGEDSVEKEEEPVEKGEELVEIMREESSDDERVSGLQIQKEEGMEIPQAKSSVIEEVRDDNTHAVIKKLIKRSGPSLSKKRKRGVKFKESKAVQAGVRRDENGNLKHRYKVENTGGKSDEMEAKENSKHPQLDSDTADYVKVLSRDPSPIEIRSTINDIQNHVVHVNDDSNSAFSEKISCDSDEERITSDIEQTDTSEQYRSKSSEYSVTNFNSNEKTLERSVHKKTKTQYIVKTTAPPRNSSIAEGSIDTTGAMKCTDDSVLPEISFLKSRRHSQRKIVNNSTLPKSKESVQAPDEDCLITSPSNKEEIVPSPKFSRQSSARQKPAVVLSDSDSEGEIQMTSKRKRVCRILSSVSLDEVESDIGAGNSAKLLDKENRLSKSDMLSSQSKPGKISVDELPTLKRPYLKNKGQSKMALKGKADSRVFEVKDNKQKTLSFFAGKSSSSKAESTAKDDNLDEADDDFECVVMEDSILETGLADTLWEEIRSMKGVDKLNQQHLQFLVDYHKTYLQDIFRGKILSDRHLTYKMGGKQRKDLNYDVHLGLFTDEQQDVVMDTLIKIFCKKRHKYLDYTMKVLLPEMLIKIYMEVQGVTHEEAEHHMIEAVRVPGGIYH